MRRYRVHGSAAETTRRIEQGFIPLISRRPHFHACYVLDRALIESGRADEASYSWRALEIYEQLGDPEHEAIALNNLGAFAYWNGRWDDAVALYRRAGAWGERSRRGMPGRAVSWGRQRSAS